jgi:AcrR family transcriptional regulator
MPTRREPARPLTREAVVEAALALVDAEGPDGCSMRRLGRALGVEGMAVYHYFPSKDHLLDAVVERLVGEVVIPGPEAGDALSRVEALARSYRGLARRHPRAFVLLATRRFRTEGSLRFLESVLALLEEAGFDPPAAAATFRLLGFFLNGAGLGDAAVAEAAASPGPPIDAAALPCAARAAPYLGPDHLDRNFELGLAAIVAHVRAMAPSARGRVVGGGGKRTRRS